MRKYRSYKKTILGKIVDTYDFYACELYDFLWGDRIYKISSKAFQSKRKFYWHESLAYKVSHFLPFTFTDLFYYPRKKIMQGQVRRLEFHLLGKKL